MANEQRRGITQPSINLLDAYSKIILSVVNTCQMVSHVLVVRQRHRVDQRRAGVGGGSGAGRRGLHVQRLPVLPLRALQIRVLLIRK